MTIAGVQLDVVVIDDYIDGVHYTAGVVFDEVWYAIDGWRIDREDFTILLSAGRLKRIALAIEDHSSEGSER